VSLFAPKFAHRQCFNFDDGPSRVIQLVCVLATETQVSNGIVLQLLIFAI
jgi:hypothetical protein